MLFYVGLQRYNFVSRVQWVLLLNLENNKLNMATFERREYLLFKQS